MSEQLTNHTRKALALATEAARAFNHTYVGTEHILLGLIEEGSAGAKDLLSMLGVDEHKVRAEIERLVERGPAPVSARTLPLTPRAQRAIEHATGEARVVNERCVGPEHLLLGLACDEEGVAGQVLRNLGVAPATLRAEVLRVRLAQMKIVERAVRPVRAGTILKRKMREELLAHLAAIYDQEAARLHDPSAAMEAAAQRFGNPAELARELEADLPIHERISYFVEKWLQYRAPESAARFCLRMAVNHFCLLLVILSLVLGGIYLHYGWIDDMRTLARVFGAIVLLTPPVEFFAWLAYIKMRDSLWGAFGSRKSLARALALDATIAAVVAVYLMALGAIANADKGFALQPTLMVTGVIPMSVAIASLALARLNGPTEIRDTHWALLDIDAA